MLTAVTLAISLTALVFSVFVFSYSRYGGRRDLLLKIHDQLLAPDRQHGRRVLFEMHEEGRRADDLTPDEFLAVNHALASLDMLGYLFSRRYVSRRDVVSLWGTTALRACQAAQDTGLLAMRDAQNRLPVWPYLRDLATSMVEHKGRPVHLPTVVPLPPSDEPTYPT
ncbi:MAG TPA: hypothetical protein VFX16_02720 [Pseudonocardiaceae bacterium]|nr:hypothetical protein [Pseudonocardiaceae bacterium]